MFKREESLMGAILMITLIIETASMFLAGEYAVSIGVAVIAFILLLVVAWEVFSGRAKKGDMERKDERSAQCSLRAARNGLLVSMALTAILSFMVVTGASISTFNILTWVYSWGIGTYLLSYLYYRRVV